ncbi:MAG: hypothetical protein IPM32_02735 [Ignavibacteriae bacterium]|nr:hypothetical protein [Ignavibacteriota bacterium]
MKYTIDFLPEKKIIGIKTKGRLNFQIIEEYSREAVKIARKNNCNKFIFDHRDTTIQGTILNIHSTEDELQQFGFKNSDHIAIVLTNQKKKLKVIQSTNRNDSWCILKYFFNGQNSEAINWLSFIN